MTTPTTITRIETVVQVVILLFMGGMAGAASFVHIHDLTVQHGQPSWIGWANAVVIELMSIVAGLEIRRRKRTGHPIASVVAVLLAAVITSLAAQVATAEPSVWGWIVAALPALGLLAVVKIILSRTTGPNHGKTPHTSQSGAADHGADRPAVPFQILPDPAVEPRPGPHSTAGHPALTRHPVPGNGRAPTTTVVTTTTDARAPGQPARTGSARAAAPGRRSRTGPTIAPTAGVDADRLDEHVVCLGRTVAAKLAAHNEPLTRDNLAGGIRAAGHTIGTDKASALLRRLKAPTEFDGYPPDPQPEGGPTDGPQCNPFTPSSHVPTHEASMQVRRPVFAADRES